MLLGCAQGGGVVWMRDGEVTFKGGTITNTKATVRTKPDARSHTGTGRRMLRGLRRAMCGARCVGMRDSMGPFELCGVCRGSLAAFGYGTGSFSARIMSVHTPLHRMLWCSVADGTLLGASLCGPAWVRMQ